MASVPRSDRAAADTSLTRWLLVRGGQPGDAAERQRDRKVREFLLNLPAGRRRWAA